MKTTLNSLLILVGGLLCVARAQEPIEISSPGLVPSSMDRQGLLVEDWGVVDMRLSGDGIVDGQAHVERITLAECIPAVQANSDHGAVRMTRTVYRAPVFPAGVDVLTVELSETRGTATDVLLTLIPSVGTQLGRLSARLGGRAVLVLPSEVVDHQPLLDWGFCDEAAALPGWCKPSEKCDPAFRNIRAGMGGVPIIYRFAVAPGGSADVVLGLCESHWAEAGQRPLLCRVEGAESQTVDPVAKWGQHKPGLLAFSARDANGDGRLEISVRPAPGAADRNPILNVIWIFPPTQTPPLDQILAGMSNDAARHYVDVGGDNDQSIFPPSKMEFPLHLAAGAKQQLTFLVACPGGSAPLPSQNAWSPDRLLRAARDVWHDW